MMSPLTLATISSTNPISAAGAQTTNDAQRANDAQTFRNFIWIYCSNYTGRREGGFFLSVSYASFLNIPAVECTRTAEPARSACRSSELSAKCDVAHSL